MDNNQVNIEDLNLDDVFTNPENPQPVTQVQQVVEQPPVQAPVVTPTEPYLKTSTGTVYKSADDAVKGIEHKDALIQKLRDEAIQRTGIDPVTGQPVRRAESVVDYTKDGTKFLTDLSEAAKKGDPNAYAQVQTKFVQDVMAPYAHLITGAAKSQAEEAVSAKYSDFRQFARSDDYSRTLDENPVLRDSIAAAERDPSQVTYLQSFYDMAYKLNTARKVPEIVKAAPAVVTQARPTVTSSVPPAPPSAVRTVAPSMETSESRSALIKQFESQGIEDFRF